jgi:hypothetical protein
VARRKLTLAEQLKGVRAALRSPKTPPQLRDGLKRRAEELNRKLNRPSKRGRNRYKRSGLLGGFRL